MHFKQLAAADRGSFWPKVCTSRKCVLGIPRTGECGAAVCISGMVLEVGERVNEPVVIWLKDGQQPRPFDKQGRACRVGVWGLDLTLRAKA